MAKFIWCHNCKSWDRRWPQEGKGYCCKEDSGNFLLSTYSDDGCTEGIEWSSDEG